MKVEPIRGLVAARGAGRWVDRRGHTPDHVERALVPLAAGLERSVGAIRGK